MSDQQATLQVSCNSLQTELLRTHVAMEMLELSTASTSHLSHVTLVTLEPGAAITSQVDDVTYEHTTTDVDSEQCQSHYTFLSNTDHHLQYDSLQLITSPTTSSQYMELFNNCDVTDDNDQSVGTVTSGQYRKSITLQHHAESAPATVEDYLAVLPDNPYANAPTYAHHFSKANDISMNANQVANALQVSNELQHISDISVLYRETSSSNESDQITIQTQASEIEISNSEQQSGDIIQRQTDGDFDYVVTPSCCGWVVVSVVAVAFVVVLSVFIGLGLSSMELEAGLSKQIFNNHCAILSKRKVTAKFIRTINVYDETSKQTRFLSVSVLDGAMLLGGPEELYVYNVTDERLIYSDVTPANTFWFNGKQLVASILVGNNCLASLTQNGHLTTTSFKTSQTVRNKNDAPKPNYLSFSAAHNIIYVTCEYAGVYYTSDFGGNWTYLFTSPLDTSKDIAAVRSSTVASSGLAATANGTLTAFWFIETSKDEWFISVYVLEETPVRYYFSIIWMIEVPFYHDAVQRSEVNLPDSLTLSSATQLVDDGRGNAFVVDRDKRYYNATTDIHWLWMTDTCQGQYGGVLLTRKELGVFYSIAVDNGLLYIGHDSYVSVFQLMYYT